MAYLALLHLNGTNGSTTITDAVGTLSWTSNTNVLDTSVVKFGSASLNVTTSYLALSGTFTPAASWTLDFQMRFSSVGAAQSMFAMIGPGTGNVTGATHNGNGSGITYRVSLTGATANFTTTGSKTTWVTGQYYHIESTYDPIAQKFYFYVDGVKDAEIASATPMSGAGWALRIGNDGLGGTGFNGWIDEVRWTDANEHAAGTTFTAPTVEYVLGSTIIPAAGSLVLSGQLANVANSGQRSITPPAGSLVLTGVAPLVLGWRLPTTGGLSISGSAPLLGFGVAITPATGALSVTEGVTPNVTQGLTAAIVRRRYLGTGQITDSNALTGAPTLRLRTAVGFLATYGVASRRKYSATGLMTSSMVGSPSRRSYQSISRSAIMTRRKYVATGRMSAVLAETYRTHAMNTTVNAVTEYTGFRFNSYAQIDGAYYGAGPDGLVRIDGDNDAGANINWKIRTGQTDDKQIELKRLPEVVMGLRASGPVRVRVYPDDNQFFDYMLPNVNTATIRQHRVKPGKGMRGRYFAVELQGTSNAAIELDSLQLNFKPTTRRLG